MRVFTVLVSLCVLVSKAVSEKEWHVDLQRMQNQLNNMQEIIIAQQDSIKILNDNKLIQDKINIQQNEENRALRKEHKTLEAKMSGMRGITTEARSTFNAMGCLSDILTLSCPDNRLIQVTRAEYGRYSYSCTYACCAPNPQYDCTEDVATNYPEDWVYLKYLCDNQTSCDYEYKGRAIPECADDYVADYVQIFYDCLREPSATVVGFTASASETRSYEYTETVLFDVIDSNFGGHYNAATSTFLCPYHATYMFSVSYLGGAESYMLIQMMRDNTLLAFPYVDAVTSSYQHASALVITECSPGQLVWVQAGGKGEMEGNGRFSLFSGYLMQRLD